jgi:hypothetical protein
MHQLLHGQEKEVFGDQAYWNESHRRRAQALRTRYRINRRGSRSKPLSDYQRFINQVRSKARARGEHAFHVVKCLWGFTKVRYRGLAKNTARLFTAFALANLYPLRRRLLPPGRSCLFESDKGLKTSQVDAKAALPARFSPLMNEIATVASAASCKAGCAKLP